MAFSVAQRADIAKFLGYPLVFETDNYRLRGALDLIGAVPEKQAIVEGILNELVTLDDVIAEQAQGTAQGALKRADEVEFYAPKDSFASAADLISPLRRARTLCGRLSIVVGVAIEADYFDRYGYSGDGWALAGNQIGGVFPLG